MFHFDANWSIRHMTWNSTNLFLKVEWFKCLSDLRYVLTLFNVYLSKSLSISLIFPFYLCEMYDCFYKSHKSSILGNLSSFSDWKDTWVYYITMLLSFSFCYHFHRHLSLKSNWTQSKLLFVASIRVTN